MFQIARNDLQVDSLYDIASNYSCIINDGDYDILYTGTNKYGSKILGSIVYEDDEEGILRYFHIIISPKDYLDFVNGRRTLRSLIDECKTIGIADKKYSGATIAISISAVKDIPVEYLPLANSYCPTIGKLNTLDFSFALHGGLADEHLGIPESVNSVNTIITNFLGKSGILLKSLGLSPHVYSRPALAGSYEINFHVELKVEDSNLFTLTNDNSDVQKVLSDVYKYMFLDLPKEPENILKDDGTTSDSLTKVINEIENIHLSRATKIDPVTAEQKVLDLISYSVDQFKDIKYQGFNSIEVKSEFDNGKQLPIGNISEEYFNSVYRKVPAIDVEKKIDVIETDESPGRYEIEFYNLNKETGKGGAYHFENGKKIKVQVHLKGREDYSNTEYSKSLDSGISIMVSGIGVKKNGVLKFISIQL